jgi:hypothetical protein
MTTTTVAVMTTATVAVLTTATQFPFALRQIFRILSVLIWPLLPIHCSCGGLLFHLITHSDTHAWWDSFGPGIGPLQRPLPESTQQDSVQSRT